MECIDNFSASAYSYYRSDISYNFYILELNALNGPHQYHSLDSVVGFIAFLNRNTEVLLMKKICVIWILSYTLKTQLFSN